MFRLTNDSQEASVDEMRDSSQLSELSQSNESDDQLVVYSAMIRFQRSE